MVALHARRTGALLSLLALGACSSSARSTTPDAGTGTTDARPTPTPRRVTDAGARPDVAAAPDAARDASADHAVVRETGPDATPPIDAAGVESGADGAVVDAGALVDAGPPALRYIGRVDTSDPAGPRFEWSGTQVVARFTGPAITLKMSDSGNYFNVIIDGALQPSPIVGSAGQTDYALATGLANGTHEVRLYRRTEASVATTQILGVTVPSGGALLPPAAPSSRRLEAIGDSITCGYGVLGEGGPSCDGTNAVEDHYDTYEAVAARALGADLITTSWSGKGMFENYGGAMTATLPDLYPYTLPNEPGPSTLWTFASWTPDAVVVNLGTNDFWNGDPGSGYETAYLTFLQTVRANYPDALILCANGPMLFGDEYTQAAAYIQGAIASMQAAGDTKVELLALGIQDGSNGYGCDYHPSPPTHAQMAVALEGALQAALGW